MIATICLCLLFGAGIARDRSSYAVIVIICLSTFIGCLFDGKIYVGIIHAAILVMCAFLGYFMFVNMLTHINSIMNERAGNLITQDGLICNINIEDEEYTVYDSEIRMFFSVPITDMEHIGFTVGDFVTVRGTVNLYEFADNPYEFDYADYRISNRNIYSINGRIDRAYDTPRLYKIAGVFINKLYVVRSSIRETINKYFGEYAGIVNASLLGDKSLITAGQTEYYRDSGISHLLAISGMHIGIGVMCTEKILSLIHVGKRKKRIASLVTALIMTAICGFVISSVRVLIMTLIRTISTFTAEKDDTITSVCISAVISFFIYPPIILSTGFTLSHYAVASFSCVNKFVRTNIKSDKARLYVGIFAPAIYWIMSLPVTASGFGTICVYGAITNMAVASFFTVSYIFSLPGVILGICGFGITASFFAFISTSVIYVLNKVAETVASLPFAVIDTMYANVFFCFLPAFFFLCFAVGIRNRRMESVVSFSCVAIIITAFILTRHLIRPEVKIVFFDVGYGDSAMLEYKDGTVIVIDGGADENAPALNYCIRNGIRHIDCLILTHGHTDHITGLMHIAKSGKVKIGTLVTSHTDRSELTEELRNIAEKSGISKREVQRGDNLNVGSMDATVLWPDCDRRLSADDGNLNNDSVVLAIKVCGRTLLFTGDIEKTCEMYIMESVDDVDLLKTAHHGSATSSTKEFISVALPDISVISVGKNSYNHPNRDVIDRLENAGSIVYVTQKCNAVVICITESEIYREKWQLHEY